MRLFYTRFSCSGAFSLFFLLLSLQTFAQCPSIVWADEFDGSSLDESKWNYQLGDGCAEGICGWGNNELQAYQQSNVTVSNGSLKITAKKERNRGSQYTSGRINSKNKGDFTYGRYEARIKLPAGDGLWPAFWMLSTNEPYGGWPQSGEIDIMEFTASNPSEIYGTIHYGDLYPNNQYQGNAYQLSSGSFPEAFHEFALEWEAGEIRWLIDGILYSRKTIDDVAPYNWPFDQDFHFLLNVAVGGNLGGPVNDGMLPATMEVDYVRVLDGFKPYLEARRTVLNQAEGEEIILGNLPNNASVSWSVPQGATITSGQGSDRITVDYGNSSGAVSATYATGCSTETLAVYVTVEPPYSKVASFENFDAAASAVFASATGNLTEVANPAPDAVNASALAGRYQRDAASQYDLLVYNVSTLQDASAYVNKDKKFYMDVYTDAPIGTEVLIQLETPTATANNYPSGRHSRYLATITENGRWQRLIFNPLDRPDPAAADADVSSLLLLFAANSYTSDVYFFDNLDSYAAGSVQTPNAAPTVSILSPTDGSSYVEGTNLTISASATDSDGNVTSVSFYANGGLIGTDTSAPFEASWTVTPGSHALTAIATDNEGATASSPTVTISGQATGSATHVLVSSITTGTISAGKGSKAGTATVTVVNNLNQPVAGATVQASFSGTFTENQSAQTDAAGIARFQTSGSSKGTVVVNLCVDQLTASGLTYDPAQNTITCSNASGARMANRLKKNNTQNALEEIRLFPNPAGSQTQLQLPAHFDSATLLLYNFQGRLMLVEKVKSTSLILNLQDLPKGMYLLKIMAEQQPTYIGKLVRQ